LLAGHAQLVTNALAEDITYPVNQFSDGKAKFFTHKATDGVAIKYFVIKSPDGVVRAAFDACDVCWPEAKGYQQKGDYMACKNCGKQFHANRINEVFGGCNPAPLTRKLENQQLVIKTDDILKGRRYFDLKGVKR
jgi:uncharacterized membrane protein